MKQSDTNLVRLPNEIIDIVKKRIAKTDETIGQHISNAVISKGNKTDVSKAIEVLQKFQKSKSK